MNHEMHKTREGREESARGLAHSTAFPEHGRRQMFSNEPPH